MPPNKILSKLRGVSKEGYDVGIYCLVKRKTKDMTACSNSKASLWIQKHSFVISSLKEKGVMRKA